MTELNRLETQRDTAFRRYLATDSTTEKMACKIKIARLDRQIQPLRDEAAEMERMLGSPDRDWDAAIQENSDRDLHREALAAIARLNER